MDIQTRDMTFTSGQTTLAAYLARPVGDGPFPGLAVIHEAYGLTEHIRDMTRRLAAEGYVALAADLFYGRSRVICMARFMGSLIRGQIEHFGIRDLKAALTTLAAEPGVDAERLGAIGFCMGGGFAIAWACTDPRLKVIAPFYGANPRPLDAVARSCPVVGSYPDPDFSTAHGRALDKALDGYEIEHDIKIYPGAKHSFMNSTNPARYNAEASADAWTRVLAFFGQHLA